ncbi:MAG: bifunctional DNA-formamidopyrimidine glycosylase/DNA-(apurinic or apyrimidinic site) lyase [Patescibacteria group bacterium]
MPELPEVETVVRGLQFLRGKRVRSVTIFKPKLVSVGPKTLSPKRVHTARHVRAFQRALVGRTILGITRRAKLIVFKLDGGWWLLVHLKMSGQIIVKQKSQRRLLIRLYNSPTAPLEEIPSKHTHIVLSFTDGTILYYNDTRVFGTWRAVHTRDIVHIADLQGYGPEPLGRKFAWQDLQIALQRRPNMELKPALTDQTLLAGVGNIYADETLFTAKLRPMRVVSSLNPADWQRLYRSLQRVLRHAIKTHGSSVGDFIRPDGQIGTFGKYHKVYDRKGKPCVVCGTPIRRITLGGRSTHFCPSCQK